MTEFPGQPSADIERFILDGLRRQKNVQDALVPYLIEKTSWNWQDCELYIEKVKTDHKDELSKWQGNLYTYLSIGMFFIGIIFLIFIFESTVRFGRLFQCTAVGIDQILNGTETRECMIFGLEVVDGMANTWTYLSLLMIGGGIFGYIYAQNQKASQVVVKNE